MECNDVIYVCAVCLIFGGVIGFIVMIGYMNPWFQTTKVTQINTCCRFETNITGYVFMDYKFAATIKTSCTKTSCFYFNVGDFLSQIESDIKQGKSFI